MRMVYAQSEHIVSSNYEIEVFFMSLRRAAKFVYFNAVESNESSMGNDFREYLGV